MNGGAATSDNGPQRHLLRRSDTSDVGGKTDISGQGESVASDP